MEVQGVTQVYKTETCVVCLDEDSSQVLNPCGHLCMCLECTQAICQINGPNSPMSPNSPMMNLCPLCRKNIVDHATQQEMDQTSTPVQEDVLSEFMKNRDDYLKAANAIIVDDNDDFIIDINQVNGYLPSANLINEILSIRDGTRCTNIAFEMSSYKYKRDRYGVRGPGTSYRFKNFFGVSNHLAHSTHLNKDETLQRIKNFCFVEYANSGEGCIQHTQCTQKLKELNNINSFDDRLLNNNSDVCISENVTIADFHIDFSGSETSKEIANITKMLSNITKNF